MLGNLQRIAFAKWTRTLGFFEYNPVNGYIEMRWLAPNTLVLTNSKALYSIIQPENPEQRFNRHTFQFPSEESFKFFSNGDKKISSSYYETAKNLFDSEPFFGGEKICWSALLLLRLHGRPNHVGVSLLIRSCDFCLILFQLLTKIFVIGFIPAS